MLSVLIPVYNWDITALVKQIHAQCSQLSVEFEILALDDFSTNLSVRNKNSELKLAHYTHHQSPKNLGNAEARNQLSRMAKYDYFLFLDCDVMPVGKEFVKRYLKFIGEPKIINGGIKYEDLKDEKFSLRWKFGKKHEEISPLESQKNPYLNIRGCNFFIPKEIFLQHPFKTLRASYGYVDTFFALSLEKAGVEVLHIDNPVFHLGLEENNVYINKFHQSIQNAKWLAKEYPEISGHLRLVVFYNQIRKFGLHQLIALIFPLVKPFIVNNLTSKNPSLFLFQVYKLGYLCALKDE